MNVNGIFEFLNGLFPTSLACDFDNVGLLIGDSEAEVNKCLVALDCTDSAVNQAVSDKCELIITHHPVIFEPLKKITADTVVYKLIKNGISVISMHTNLDIASGGVNDSLCKVLELKNISDFQAKDGFTLRQAEISPVSADDFALYLKQKLGGSVKYVCGKEIIQTVLVCSGSGGQYIDEAVNHGFDALVTSEVKHHQFIEGMRNGVSVFDAGHYNTEAVVLSPLCDCLKSKFKDIRFIEYYSNDVKTV